MNLRRASAADAPAIAAVYRVSAWHPHIHTPEEDVAFFRDRMIAEQTVWVLEGEAGIVAYAGTTPGWLNHLFVHPDQQGAGHGSRLLAKVMEGAPEVQLWTFQGNSKARAFYEARGFVPAELTDGSGNEEGLPDVRYVWRREAAHDAGTLAFYDRESAAYAARSRGEESRQLTRFMARLPAGAAILELGTGGGQDAEAMLSAGFAVTPTDGSPALAAQAEARLGRPVRVMLFEDLDEDGAYEAVWAQACLLHVPEERLPGVLARVHRALKPGGRFFASFKAGEGGGRDGLGRYYNFPSRAGLEADFRAAGTWSALDFDEGAGGGYDGVERAWLAAWAVKG